MQAQRPESDGESQGGANRLTRFFTSVTGVITSLVALIGAAGTLYIAVAGQGSSDPPRAAPLATSSSSQSATPVSSPPSPPAAPTQSTPQPSIADWRREANQICDDFNRQVRSSFGRPPANLQEYAVYLDQVRPMATRTSIDLAGLDRPPSHADEIADLVDAWNARDASAIEALNAWSAGNAPAYQRAVAEVTRLDTKGSRIAAALGASECAANPFT